MNHNFAEYHVPVNADIGDIDVIFVDEDDRIVSPWAPRAWARSASSASRRRSCNAIFHATGRRVRSTPMTPDRVMAPPA